MENIIGHFSWRGSTIQCLLEKRGQMASSSSLSRLIERLQRTIPNDPFTFIIDGTPIESTIFNAALLSPLVGEHISLDTSVRSITFTNDLADRTHLSSLQKLVSGDTIHLRKSQKDSFVRLCRLIGNVDFEHFFFSLWPADGRSSFRDTVDVTLFAILSSDSRRTAASTFYLHSAEEIACLSQEALEAILTCPALKVKSEDWLVQVILESDSSDVTLVQHVRLQFLSSDGISFFAEHFQYSNLTEDIWANIISALKILCDSSSSSQTNPRGMADDSQSQLTASDPEPETPAPQDYEEDVIESGSGSESEEEHLA
jgi:hypothetical protein